jgi:hypothetical protein
MLSSKARRRQILGRRGAADGYRDPTSVIHAISRSE